MEMQPAQFTKGKSSAASPSFARSVGVPEFGPPPIKWWHTIAICHHFRRRERFFNTRRLKQVYSKEATNHVWLTVGLYIVGYMFMFFFFKPQSWVCYLGHLMLLVVSYVSSKRVCMRLGKIVCCAPFQNNPTLIHNLGQVELQYRTMPMYKRGINSVV